MRFSLPSGLRRFLLTIGIVMLILLALPYLLVPLYRFVDDPVSIPMTWRFITGSRVERIYVPISRIAPSLPLTVIIAEDGSFCRNRGVDLARSARLYTRPTTTCRKRAAAPPSPNRR